MVSLSAVQSSNSLIPSTLPRGLVAVFVGGTSGIGESTLKKFAKLSITPRIYIIGRSQEAGERIEAECRLLNPEGVYIFIQADVSLIRVVDELCEEIKAKETHLNILFLSAGLPILDRRETPEHLHLLASLNYYSRLRFITNLLPLLQRASALRRVVTVAGGGLEGPLDPSDFPALHVPLRAIRGHLTTLITLGLEAVATKAPEVSFVHDYPGTVKTPLMSRTEGFLGVFLRALVYLLGRWMCVPLEESGDRHLYLATSARYPPRKGESSRDFAVPLGSGVEVARGTTGEAASGVYSVGWDCEGPSPAAEKLLAGLREAGMVDEIWRHTEKEFKRITE
ncbi:hypothetical protein BP6252_07989 [Coleophoma cylindrospora]|uniref:Uncharacterized protein n=1 Tax=Coleophoma cylindrospora TaxID=1849047 RepID=A0A3D8RBT4_9HELO|nr:hypothetical protein BP6252_07989 [Coleophoma cylindrospora]